MIRGLGDQLASMVKNPFGFTVNCADWSYYYLEPVCWDYTRSAWQQMNTLQTAAGPLPTPAPPAAPSGTVVPSSPQAADQTITDMLTAGWQETTTALQDYFGGAATSIGAAPADSSSFPWALVIGAGVVAALLSSRR